MSGAWRIAEMVGGLDDPERAGLAASNLARAAFRAVPGLRE
jgi:hypothetical protein